MNRGLEYIKYQWNAKRRHGVHSPFIYDLTDKCFKTPISINLQNTLRSLDNLLKADKTIIEITDFGAGSKKLSNSRKISDIYKTSSSKGKFGKILFQLVQHYKPKNVLEFGTSMGIGSICMASGLEFSNIITVEGCPNTYKVALENINSSGLKNITAINSTFNDYIKSLKNQQFDMVFIDGHHDGQALTDYLEALKPFTNNDTIFILDDIRWSNSMFEAWNAIKSKDTFHVSIDLFRMGIIVSRKEQEKEHFIIR